MWMLEVTLLLAVLNWNSALGARITNVSPRTIGMGGAVRVTIYGTGLAAEQYSDTGDEDAGTRIFFVSESEQEITCPVHKDGCTTSQMTCDTPMGMTDEPYYVNAIIDGQPILEEDRCDGNPKSPSCTFLPVRWRTPTIDVMTPQSGQPGDMVQMWGRITSDRYGTNIEFSSNGIEERILKVYLGPRQCELKDGDIFYGLALDNEESRYGTMTCKTQGKSVGYYLASFLLETPYGRSLPDADLYRVSHNDLLYLYQLYTAITSLSVHEGSREGGLLLTINGLYFSEQPPYTKARAYIDVTECTITAIEMDYIQCMVVPDPALTDALYIGNRGIIYEYWNDTAKGPTDVGDVLDFTSSNPGYNVARLDEAYHEDVTENYVSRMTSYFTPPHSGQYEFMLKADDGATLFVDGVEAVTSRMRWATSSRMSLQQTDKYLLHVVHYQTSGDANVHLKAKLLNTGFKSSDTAKAEQERQTVHITSSVVHETQKLEFLDFTPRTATYEEQTIKIDTSGSFRLGLYGVYTEPMTVDVTAEAVQTAMNLLPVWNDDEYISAEFPQSFEGNGVGFEFTFKSKRGDFPMVEVMLVTPDEADTVSSTEDIQGVSDLDTLALQFDGGVSPAFSLTDLSAEQLQATVDAMFGARCPNIIEGVLPDTKVYESFEEDGVNFEGTRTKETEPFCGRYTLKNPEYIYKAADNQRGISLGSYNQLCFAYKGVLVNSLWITFTYKNAPESTTQEYDTMDFLEDGTAWHYTCINIYDLVQSTHADETNHYVEAIAVAQHLAEEDIYIDAVFMGAAATTTDTENIGLLRMAPLMPNGAIVDTVTVSSNQPNVYTVTLRVFECGYDFPLINLAHTQVISHQQEDVEVSVMAQQVDGSRMVTTRLDPASPPVTGTITATFNGNFRSGLDVELEEAAFQRDLQFLEGIGDLSVARTGDCANFDFAVTFQSLPGDVPEMTVTSALSGIDTDVRVSHDIDGGLIYDLVGDMMFTVYDSPQVKLSINDVPVTCDDCSFQWTENATPTVTSVDPDIGTFGDEIEIVGTKFSETSAENEVTIGGVACNVTSATATLLHCTTGSGPIGSHKVKVNVNDKGDAAHPDGDVKFAYNADIDEISPTAGSRGGGGELTLTGYGFGSSAIITVGNHDCPLVGDVHPDMIVCVIPLSTTFGSVDVTVNQDGVELVYHSYTYDDDRTAYIDTVSPTTIGVQGGEITITGEFTETVNQVLVGDHAATVTEASSTEIVVVVDAINPGVYDLQVQTDNGNAVYGDPESRTYFLPKITVDLVITGIYPRVGSVEGGTVLTITGSGFGEDMSVIDMNVGETGCPVVSLRNRQIVCQIAHTRKTHLVTNRGIHPVYKENYAFDPQQITIDQGDRIRWNWYTPQFINNVQHAIIQIDSPGLLESKVDGFSSGDPTPNGEYLHEFRMAGTFFIWSGIVDDYGIKSYIGQVDVVPKASSVGEISVTVDGIEALYDVTSDVPDPTDSSECQPFTAPMSICSANQLLPMNVDKFSFIFSTCHTPVVNTIDLNMGTTRTVVTVNGAAFSPISCQNELALGQSEFYFETTSADEHILKCNLMKSGEPNLEVMYPISLRHANHGYAILNMRSEHSSFRVLPNIDLTSPNDGSLAGGTWLQISGYGFDETSYVTVGGLECPIMSRSITEITCETPRSESQSLKDIEVFLTTGGIRQKAECNDNRDCQFIYGSNKTPTVSDIIPLQASMSQEFTIGGKRLGTDQNAVSVQIGGETATVRSVDSKEIVVYLENVPVGENSVTVRIDGVGYASGSLIVTGQPQVTSVDPAEGSIHGDTTITVTGSGFIAGDTNVTIGGATCHIEDVSLSSVTCTTSAHDAATVPVEVTSNDIEFPTVDYSYSEAATPVITEIDPAEGLAGDTITIVGENFGDDYQSIYVSLDDTPCEVLAIYTSTEIDVIVGDHETGPADVYVHVAGFGSANVFQFSLKLDLLQLQPITGGTAGGQWVELTGEGFENSAEVTICDETCQFVEATSTTYTCITPANTDQATCDVVISVNGVSKSLQSSYTYDSSLMGTILSVSPRSGGTSGGTRLTITGSGFGTTLEDISVTIDGSVCVCEEVADDSIVCVTSSHAGSTQAIVDVQRNLNGRAQPVTPEAADYEYMYAWSSPTTWGGESLPQEGEFVYIPGDMTLLLDTSTPVLKYLLICGRLIVAEMDLELIAENIMIICGGAFVAGTEDEPFLHQFIITLVGHNRDREQPTYGTKGFACRNCTVELHGRPVTRTWTYLATTAEAGATEIELKEAVDWQSGDYIVIATTGGITSQGESEKMRIAEVRDDGKTIVLESALVYMHICFEEDFGGRICVMCAEVGLLTHTIVFRGDDDTRYHKEIVACAQGFQPGEFTVQQCFQGLYGDEIGTSEFGAHMMFHGVNEYEAIARIAYVEFTFVGQAHRLGRYPIHFHLNHDMSMSYVRGCSIHKSFNRALNIHNSHYTLVEHVVVYDILGGAFFLEDGAEIGNIWRYNLAIFVQRSTSLLNDDVTAAAFWVLNPNNTVIFNAAAGGTHFGFWYRMTQFPTGPSFTTDICPRNVALGTFHSNSAHSMGWFGLWVFEFYYPLVGGCGGTVHETAIFRNFTAWFCQKGAEGGNFGAVQFSEFCVIQNTLAGIQGKSTTSGPLYTEGGPGVINSVIAAYAPQAASISSVRTKEGIVLPQGQRFQVKDTTFVNFDSPSSTAIGFNKLKCPEDCGGFNYHFENTSRINTNNLVSYKYRHEGVLVDVDGSLTGVSGSSILPTIPILPQACIDIEDGFSTGLSASLCPQAYKPHRWAFNNMLPISLEGKDLQVCNNQGCTTVPMGKKRATHPMGWVMNLFGDEEFRMSFVGAEHVVNISYTSRHDEYEGDNYIIFSARSEEEPDRVSTDGGSTLDTKATGPLDPSTAFSGDWTYDYANNTFSRIVSASRRIERDLSTLSTNINENFSVQKCYFEGCVPPPDPDTIIPLDGRPPWAVYWDQAQWNNSSIDGYVENVENVTGTYGLPHDGDDVRIVEGTWLVARMPISEYVFGVIYLEGTIEFDDVDDADYKISADHIIIMGGRFIIGWPTDPFDGLAEIVLTGHSMSPVYHAEGDGPNIGSMSIAVFGGLDLFGQDVGVAWTMLAETAMAGSDRIILLEGVSWSAGDTVVIAATSYAASEVETHQIASVDGTTLMLETPLQYTHTAYYETITGTRTTDLQLAAAVANINRNIKVMGQVNNESFGGRVVGGLQSTKARTYTGYIRSSNVEYQRMGQPYMTASHDPRFCVSFVGTGEVSLAKPSFMDRNVFHDLYSTAMGAFGTSYLNITDNVVFGAMGNAIEIESDNTRLIHNYVNLMQWPGSYNGNYERFNFHWEAAIWTLKAILLTMQDNLVSGSQRCGYRVNMLPCDDVSGRYSNNRAFSCLIGVLILPEDELTGDCTMVQGFVTWKNLDFGIYVQNTQSLKFDGNIYAENGQGVFSRANDPTALSHETSTKTITVSDSVFVGQISTFACDRDVSPTWEPYYQLSGFSRPAMAPGGGMIAVTFPSFMSGSNSAPKKPFINDKKYPALSGLMTIKNVTFAHFSTSSCSGSYILGTNRGNSDYQHPVHLSGVELFDVDDDQKVVIHEPVLAKINSADCIDMDCDAMKKVLIKDLDGSFLGAIGSLFSVSEAEWDGDTRRGLGNYRIPSEMLTTMDGDPIPADTKAPNKGIARDDSCTLVDAWNAHKCTGPLNMLNHEVLIIESMDPDTETRRLSPVAIVCRGYIDLINGPQDHGCCSGYGCRKRISTFYSIIPTGEECLLHFTSTNPFILRFRLINVDADTGLKLNTWYSRPYRLDIYVAGQYIDPLNIREIPGKAAGLFPPEGGAYDPQMSDPTGTNLMQYTTGILTTIVKGTEAVEVRTKEVIVPSFSLPFMTEEDFYGDNIVENLIEFLNVPPSKVRVVNIVNNGVDVARRKRAASTITVTVEIGDEPVQNVDDTVADPMDYETLVNLAADLVHECQVGNISALLNATGFCQSVVIPPTSASEEGITYSTPIPDRLVIAMDTVAGQEGRPFRVQPRLQVLDSLNAVVRKLGTAEHPWKMSVSIRAGTGHPNAVLLGTTNVTASNGLFTYTDLSISHMGSGYVLDFSIVLPTLAAHFVISTPPFDVSGRPVNTHVAAITTSLLKDSSFYLVLDLRDSDTGDIIHDIAWRDHSWTAEARILGTPKYASISGTLNTEFDPGTGQALFPDLIVTGFGLFYIQFHVYSTPADMDLTYNYKLRVENPLHANMVPEDEYEVQVKFDEDYSAVLPTADKENEFEQTVLQEISYRWPNIRMKSGSMSRGSIVVTFMIDGSVSDLNSTAYSLCDSIYTSTEYTVGGYTLTMSPYLTVNGQAYYGVTCGEMTDDSDEDKDKSEDMKPYLIAIIVLLCVLTVAAIVVILVWCFVVKPHSQTHDISANTHFHSGKHEFREDTFTSMQFRMPHTQPQPPSATRMTPRLHLLDPFDSTKLPVNSGRLTPVFVTKVDVDDHPPSAGSRRSDILYDSLHGRANGEHPSPAQSTLTFHGETA